MEGPSGTMAPNRHNPHAAILIWVYPPPCLGHELESTSNQHVCPGFHTLSFIRFNCFEAQHNPLPDLLVLPGRLQNHIRTAAELSPKGAPKLNKQNLTIFRFGWRLKSKKEKVRKIVRFGRASNLDMHSSWHHPQRPTILNSFMNCYSPVDVLATAALDRHSTPCLPMATLHKTPPPTICTQTHLLHQY